MSSPQRIQRKRTKGFNLKELSKSVNGLDYVCVSRPSKWGNPFIIGGDMIYGDVSHRRKFLRPGAFIEVCSEDKIRERVVGLFEKWINDGTPEFNIIPRKFTKEDIKKELKGKNLVCFCRQDQLCHADVLLKIANEV